MRSVLTAMAVVVLTTSSALAALPAANGYKFKTILAEGKSASGSTTSYKLEKGAYNIFCKLQKKLTDGSISVHFRNGIAHEETGDFFPTNDSLEFKEIRVSGKHLLMWDYKTFSPNPGVDTMYCEAVKLKY